MCAEPTYYRSPLRTLKKHGSGGGQSGQQRGRGGVQQGEDAGRGGRHVGVQGARQVGTGQQGQQALQHLWEDGIAEHGGGVGEGDGEQLQHGPDLLGLACGTRQEEGRRGDAGIGGGTCRFGWWWAVPGRAPSTSLHGRCMRSSGLSFCLQPLTQQRPRAWVAHGRVADDGVEQVEQHGAEPRLQAAVAGLRLGAALLALG